MNTLDALVTAVLGYGVVFLGIVLLIAVVALVGKAMTATRKKAATQTAAPAPVPAPEPVPAPPEPKAPGTAGDLKLYDTPERDAAMIMAIVAHELRIPLNELRFISIKEVHKE